MIGNEQDKLSYLLSCKEINDDIHKIIDIEDFFLFRDQVFILKRYYELSHNSRKEGYLSRGIYTFEDGSDNILVQFASAPTVVTLPPMKPWLSTTSMRSLPLNS